MNQRHAFGVLFSRDLKNLFLTPSWVMYNTVFPLMLVWVLGYLTEGNYGGMGVTSYDFYGVTLLIFGALSTAMTSANSFMEHRIKGSNLRVLYSPIRPSLVYLAKIAATFVFAVVCFTGVVGVLYFAFGVYFGTGMVGYIVTIVLLLALLGSTLGVAFCCLLRSEELANKVLSPVIQMMAILGGLFFPLDGLSPTLERVSWLSPVKWVAEAVFRVIYDHDAGLFAPVVLVLSLCVVGALATCKFTFRTEDYV